MPLTRQRLLDALIALLEPLPHVHALWEGGSAAFGRLDELSDIDLVADVDAGQIDAVFATIETCLEQLSPLARRHVLPLPTWHGHAQRFYQFRDADENLILDLVLMAHAQPPRFMEVEQHGQAVVHFDKLGVVVPEHIDAVAWRAKITARLTELRDMFQLDQSFVRKEARRNRELDALHFYFGLTLRPLVELLRLRYDPYRYTFGLRYLYFDLPEAVVVRLKPLCFIADLAGLLLAQREAEEWGMELLDYLEREGVQL